MEQFKDLGLTPALLESLEQQGITEPTEIQHKAIPPVLQGKDIIAGSETGSGKTFAFGLPIVQNISSGGGVQALILTPTRELADQIAGVLKEISRFKKLSVAKIYGGVSYNPQYKSLEKADIVVATPGRLLDHLEKRTIDLSFVKFLVLDEADRMLDMGFIDDVRRIMSQCPKKRQSLLFSATIPPEIESLSKQFMHDPERIQAGTYVDPKKLHQVYYDVAGPMKFSLLAHLLKEECEGLVMVFCNSRRFTDMVSRNLKKQNIPAMGIHGGLTQDQRKKVLEIFNSKQKFVLVCTDVAARGLDIPGVSHVYNYDIPPDSKQYIHRIGRTARAGKDGKVVNLISDMDYDTFGRVLRDFDVDVKKVKKPFVERVDMSRSLPRSQGQRRGANSRRDSRPQRKSGPRQLYGSDREERPSHSNSPRRHDGSRGRGGPRREGSSRSSGGRGGPRRYNGRPKSSGRPQQRGNPRRSGGARRSN